MMDIQERRAKGAGRVAIDTLVEICGNEPGIPAFEAEALDVSARGMHLRTAYLPEEGAPLVCRFEDRGREIVVEGLVAWRKESEKGGDFGVSFTALDSRSVEALKTLLKTGDGDAGGTEQGDGSKVRLHIEGLASPMKARVRSSSGTQKIQVGSSLEFLKVGRRLEVEDVEAGSRRAALIDGVEVLINPKTRVPQLVVALRYDGATEDTPEPTTTDLAGGAPAEGLRLSADAVTTDAGRGEDEADPEPSGDQPEASSDDDEDDLEAGVGAATRAARKLGTAAENAGVVARDASARAARWGATAFQGLGKALGGKLAGLRTKAPEKRRTTSIAPEAPLSSEGRRLRPQSGKSEPAAQPARKRPAPKHVAMAAAAAVLLGTVGAMALRSDPAPQVKAPDAAAATPAAPGAQPPAAAAMPAAAPSTPSIPGAPVTANVPLFGPTPLATLEPAPLGPPPTGDAASEEALELAAAKAATPPEAADEEFTDAPGSKAAGASKKDEAGPKKPEDVAPFGNGRMHLPVISRLRLDGAGSELRGVADATGFTVLIPGRKVMEKGDAIAKRDARIGRFRTTNTPGGAQVRVTFKESVPAYRVRLRRDFVEFLISAPEEKPKKAAHAPSVPAKAASKSIPAIKPAAKK